MFVYSSWDELCLVISKHFKTVKINQILEQSQNTKWLAIKHDVETNVQKALEIAKIEHSHNIQSTYYIQADLVDENFELLQEIALLGHEVSYHYDVLDANLGNFEKSIKEFENNIKKFNSYGFDVTTVCPHGNPVMNRHGWTSNKDFFRNTYVEKHFFKILDMVVQLPKKLGYKYTYVSDAGYGWKKIANIEYNDIKNRGDINLSFDELVQLIKTDNNIIISSHPHRWENSKVIYFIKILRFKILRLIARVGSKTPVFKQLLFKFYFLAKKI